MPQISWKDKQKGASKCGLRGPLTTKRSRTENRRDSNAVCSRYTRLSIFLNTSSRKRIPFDSGDVWLGKMCGLNIQRV